MAVKIRLKRMGSKKRPFYRIVAADSRSPRDGRFIEILGTYNPLTNPIELKLNDEKVLTWLKNGAKPTQTARNLLSKGGILAKFAETKTNNKEKTEKKDTPKKVTKKTTEVGK